MRDLGGDYPSAMIVVTPTAMLHTLMLLELRVPAGAEEGMAK
jgi:hypothetical protein